MDRQPRRHFFNSRNEWHYSRKRGKKMNSSKQELIDTLKSVIGRLDKLIHKMTGNSK